jgi:hypothetical protein
MANITYLLGAGASANCLPTYANFRQRFYEFYCFLDKFKDVQSINQNPDYKNLKTLVENINNEFAYHSTPDTIAKKYFHVNTSHLANLKRVVILFFLYEQTMFIAPNEKSEPEKDNIDKRYDAFIAAILKPIPDKIEIVENIKVLSWNYDLQFEIAYSKYRNVGTPGIQREIQSYPKILKDTDSFKADEFAIIHLNGIAYDKGENQDFIGYAIDDTLLKLDYLINVFHRMFTAYRRDEISGVDLFSFAWEKLSPDFSIKPKSLENAFKVAENTEWLIINGYSFPSFNRLIDTELLKRMTKLRRISIQSPCIVTSQRSLKA